MCIWGQSALWPHFGPALTTNFSPDGRKRFYLASAVNVIAAFVWGTVISVIVR